MPNAEKQTMALDQVLGLVVVLNDDMTRSLSRDGLTVARAHLLWALRQRGPTTQRLLADALGVSARNVTGLVDGLEATGFVTREPHPGDRRATLVSFTEHGTAIVTAMERGQDELAELLFAGMPDHRFEAFVQGLGEVLDRLRSHLLAADHEGSDG